MSRTTKTSTTPLVTDLAAALHAGTVTIEVIDPATAELDPNVRQNPDYTIELLDSIRAEGVREPVHARRGENGTVYVWDGQRRLLAARDAGISGILAVFGLRPETDNEGARLLDQLRTFNRTDLTLTDRIAAYHQLAFEGISVTAIARAAGTKKDEVTASLTVAKSATATTAAASGQLSLDRLLLIAEFDGDQDAAERIAACDDEEDLPYVAQEIRDQKDTAAAQQKLIGQYEAEGFAVFTRWADDFMQLTRLTDAADDAIDRPALTADAHTGCEGRAVYLTVWSADADDFRAEMVCSRPDLHHALYGRRTDTAKVDETEDEKEARLALEAQAKSDERRLVLRNNKAWRTAATVRTEWVASFLTRKKLPTDAAVFVTVTLTGFMNELSHYNSDAPLPVFLGLTEKYHARNEAAKLVESTPTRAGQVNLAIALSAHEAAVTDVSAWRGGNRSVSVYLHQLEAWGYKLSPVERTAAGYPDGADADDTDNPEDN